MIVTTFTGYVPPWGQMSFWGAIVITSLASAIPVVGDTIVTCLRPIGIIEPMSMPILCPVRFWLPWFILNFSLSQLYP